jgi:hypothetical protein
VSPVQSALEPALSLDEGDALLEDDGDVVLDEAPPPDALELSVLDDPELMLGLLLDELELGVLDELLLLGLLVELLLGLLELLLGLLDELSDALDPVPLELLP